MTEPGFAEAKLTLAAASSETRQQTEGLLRTLLSLSETSGPDRETGEVRAEFARFYHAEQSKLIRFVMWLGTDQYTAEDVVHDAFVLALEKWTAIDNPKAWLRKVCSRLLLRPAKEIAVADVSTLLSAAPDLLFPPNAGPRVATLLRALATLSPREREVMAWAMDGFTIAEIAKELRRNEPTVRKALSRARTNIKAFMTREGGVGNA